LPPQSRLPRTEFQAGLRASLPLLIAVGPFGLVTGEPLGRRLLVSYALVDDPYAVFIPCATGSWWRRC
jgi:predicted branched-subunit amino acid permease